MKAFFEARFAPRHLIEFRAIRAGDIRRFWVTLACVPTLEPELRKLDANGWDIYCAVNPRLGRRSDSKAVGELVAFHADIDGGIGNGGQVGHCFAVVKNTDERKENPADTAPRSGWDFSFHCVVFGAKHHIEAPEPTIVLSSGRGRHCYWILNSPETVTDGNREHFKSINRGLALAVGGDVTCVDLSRILRVPTFHNHKTQPPAEVTVLSDKGPRYTVEQLSQFAVTSPTVGNKETVALPETIPPMNAELDERFRALRRKNGEVSRSFRGEIGDGSSDSRYVLVKKLREAGFTGPEIAAIVTSRRWWNKRTKKVRSPQEVFRDTTRLIAKNHGA